MEILCKATTVILEGHSCHKNLKGIYINLVKLVQMKSAVHKVRQGSPLAAPTTQGPYSPQPASFLHVQLLPWSPFLLSPSPLPQDHAAEPAPSPNKHPNGLFFFLLQAPCPVAAGNTTSLHHFLEDLKRVLQRLVKDYSI